MRDIERGAVRVLTPVAVSRRPSYYCVCRLDSLSSPGCVLFWLRLGGINYKHIDAQVELWLRWNSVRKHALCLYTLSVAWLWVLNEKRIMNSCVVCSGRKTQPSDNVEQQIMTVEAKVLINWNHAVFHLPWLSLRVHSSHISVLMKQPLISNGVVMIFVQCRVYSVLWNWFIRWKIKRHTRLGQIEFRTTKRAIKSSLSALRPFNAINNTANEWLPFPSSPFL